jgi:tetratricopeptide (TPR) repeat protein
MAGIVQMNKLIVFLIVLIITGGYTVVATAKEEAHMLPEIRTLWDFNDPAGTEVKFRELIPKAKELGDKSYHVQLLTQIARTYSLRMKFEEAHKILDEAETLLTDDLVVAKIRYLLERGRAYNSNQEQDKAKPLFVKAWEFALLNNEDGFAIDAAHMMGIAETPDNQIEWNLKAIELAEKTTDQTAKGWLGPLYNNTGWSYFDLTEYEKALELFEKGLKWRKEKNDENGIRVQTWSIGRTYRALGKIDEALKIQIGIEKEFEEKGLQNSGYNYEELGELYLIKGEKEKAAKYFKLAYEILSKDQWLIANEPERLKRLKELGDWKR